MEGRSGCGRSFGFQFGEIKFARFNSIADLPEDFGHDVREFVSLEEIDALVGAYARAVDLEQLTE